MATDKQKEIQILIMALCHPLRRRILLLLEDGRTLSPTEIAEALGEVLTSVSYHIRTLSGAGLLTEVRQEQVRGATQHFYRRSLDTKWALDLLNEDR